MTDELILEVCGGDPKNLKIYIFEKEKVFLKSFLFLSLQIQSQVSPESPHWPLL